MARAGSGCDSPRLEQPGDLVAAQAGAAGSPWRQAGTPPRRQTSKRLRGFSGPYRFAYVAARETGGRRGAARLATEPGGPLARPQFLGFVLIHVCRASIRTVLIHAHEQLATRRRSRTLPRHDGGWDEKREGGREKKREGGRIQYSIKIFI